MIVIHHGDGDSQPSTEHTSALRACYGPRYQEWLAKPHSNGDWQKMASRDWQRETGWIPVRRRLARLLPSALKPMG